MSHSKKVFLVCFALLALVFSSLAQERKGTIAGTIKDSANSTLASALVELLPLGKKTASDDQGQFLFTDVPAGEDTLHASYVWLAVSHSTLPVASGKTPEAGVALEHSLPNDPITRN